MLPGRLDLSLYQGDTFSLFLRIRQQEFDSVKQVYVDGDYVDLTGYTAKSQIRQIKTGEVEAEFVCTFSSQSSTLGGVTLYLSDTATAELDEGSYVYDFELVGPGNTRETYLSGVVRVEGDVTRNG